MNPLDKVIVGMAAEKKVIVTSEMTVGHSLEELLPADGPIAPRSAKIAARHYAFSLIS